MCDAAQEDHLFAPARQDPRGEAPSRAGARDAAHRQTFISAMRPMASVSTSSGYVSEMRKCPSPHCP